MDDRPVSLPITPTLASSKTPTSVPRKIASIEPDMPSPGASKAPVCNTIRPMPRKTTGKQIRPPNTRWLAGTGVSGE